MTQVPFPEPQLPTPLYKAHVVIQALPIGRELWAALYAWKYACERHRVIAEVQCLGFEADIVVTGLDCEVSGPDEERCAEAIARRMDALTPEMLVRDINRELGETLYGLWSDVATAYRAYEAYLLDMEGE